MFSLHLSVSPSAKDTFYSRTRLAWKGFTETKRRRSTGRQPGTKSASCPAYKSRINHLSTAILFPHLVYVGFCLFLLQESRSEDLSSMLWGYEGRLSPERIVLSASRPARLRPAAPPCAPTRLARGMSGFWVRQVDISASSFFRFSENSFCRKLTRTGILRRVDAVVLSASLLATKTPVLCRSHCVGHAIAKRREHRRATV